MSLIQQSFSPTTSPIAPPVAGPQAGDTPDMVMAKLNHVLAGGSGIKAFTNTTLNAFPLIGFYCLTDVVIAGATGSLGYTWDGSMNGLTLPAGTTWPARLDDFTLTSGTLIAIKS